MEIKDHSNRRHNNQCGNISLSIIRIAQERMFNTFYQFDFIFNLTSYARQFKKELKIIDDFNKTIIAQRRLELAKRQLELKETPSDNLSDPDDDNVYFSKKKRMVLMDILLQSSIDGQPLTDDEVREEANTFLFAGHDTISATLMFLFYNIAKYADAQEKLLAEINQTFPGGQKEEITLSKLSRLSYMDCVMKESMRMYTTVPMFGRETQEEFTLSCGRTLPVGSNVTLCSSLIHSDPEIFPNPEEFIPDRFMQESSNADGRAFTYIPFSAGPRGCIGQKMAMMEMKMVVVRVLQNLSLALPQDYPPLQVMMELVLKPKNGVQLVVTERN